MVKFSENNRAKKTSKRQSIKLKFKIQRKAKDHNKKMKKEARKLKAKGILRKRKEKEIDLPNSFPQKAQMIENVLQRREDLIKFKNEEKILKKQSRKQNKMEEEMQERENEQPQVVEQKPEKKETSEQEISLISGKRYIKTFKNLLTKADILLLIIDIRDPLSCRCKRIEEMINQSKKQLIFVLNKIDLVPAEILQEWEEYFQSQKQKFISVSSFSFNQYLIQVDKNSQKEMRQDQVMASLKKIAKFDKNTTIGVLGSKNTGKMSFIKKLCKYVNMPILNKENKKDLTEVQIEENIKILDASFLMSPDLKDTLLNQITRFQSTQNPEKLVEKIMEIIPKEEILMHYKIADFENSKEFLENLALQKNLLLDETNEADINLASQYLLSDINSGKLQFYIKKK